MHGRAACTPIRLALDAALSAQKRFSASDASDSSMRLGAFARRRFRARLARHRSHESRALALWIPARLAEDWDLVPRPSVGAMLRRLASEAFPGRSEAWLAAQIIEATARVMFI